MTVLYALQRSYSWEDGGVHCDSLLLSEEHCQSNHWSLQISLFREIKACYPCLAWMNYLKILLNKINVAFTIEILPSNVHNSKANLAWLLRVPLHSKQTSWPRKKQKKKTLTDSHRHFPPLSGKSNKLHGACFVGFLPHLLAISGPDHILVLLALVSM